jgi:roadblock/LC7 domain-containing protein
MKPELAGLAVAFGFAFIIIIVGTIGVAIDFLYTNIKKLFKRLTS